MLPKVYTQYVQPHLDFAVQAWSPWLQSDVELLEKVQKKMVKNVMGLTASNYKDRLAELGLTTPTARRQRLDMIQTYKIIQGHDDVDKEEWFRLIPNDRTHMTRRTEEGHTIETDRPKTDLRRNFVKPKSCISLEKPTA